MPSRRLKSALVGQMRTQGASVEPGDVDRVRRVVTDAEGREHSYDHLVFATGARPVSGEGYVLRSIEDARAVVAAAGSARRAVVVGGGVLGVEAACALRERGLAVTLVHDGATLMDKSVRPTAGRRVTRAVRAVGVQVMLNQTAGRVDPDEFVVVACGVTPRTELASGLTVRDGIVVDRTLTSPDDPRVHAVGDCAEIDGRIIHMRSDARVLDGAVAELGDFDAMFFGIVE